MNGAVTTRPQARRDLVELADYIEQNRPAAAERFLDAAAETLALLAGMPEMGSLWESESASAEAQSVTYGRAIFARLGGAVQHVRLRVDENALVAAAIPHWRRSSSQTVRRQRHLGPLPCSLPGTTVPPSFSAVRPGGVAGLSCSIRGASPA